MTGLIQTVKAESAPIYINADGSISPSTAPIYTADNITYTLTGNITATTDGILIERNNTILNGAGYTMTGNGSARGILLENMGNLTVQNMRITNFGDGIVVEYSSNCTLSDTSVTANGAYGIYLDYSSNCTLSRNNVTANNEDGIYLYSSSDDTLSGNNATANAGNGIYFYSSSDCTLSGNNVTANSGDGIVLEYSSDNNTLSGNNVTNNVIGIYLYSSSNNNTLSGNNVTTNSNPGIELDSFSNSNVLSGNNVAANAGVGIYFYLSSDCTLSDNNFTANNGNGIHLDSSSNNIIYQNNFINNTQSQVISSNSTNVWNNGSVGNYWSDYLTKYPNATEKDGVWNTPYAIDSNNTDNYPLTVPIVVIPEFPSFLILPPFLIATLLAVIIYKKRKA